jgi:glycosyltransferase involved in cell wall biosynthesis
MGDAPHGGTAGEWVMRIAMLDSWTQASAEGSGTAVAIGGLQRALVAAGVAVERVAPVGSAGSASLATRLWYNARLADRLAQQRFAALVGFDIDGCWLPPATLARTPYVVSIKGVLAEEARHERGWPRVMLGSMAHLERRNVRRARRVFATSAYCADAIARHYGIAAGRIAIIPEGIDVAHWQRRLQACADAAPRPPTILCVARQYPRKHVADLLRAMPLVRRAIPTARAVIVGGGPEHPMLRQLARQLELGDAAHVTGALADDEAVVRHYAAADVFCLPSVQEGFGIVFLEAMVSGLPIVATRAAAIPEVVPDGTAGLLVPPGDVAALADALVALLGDPARRAACAAAGRERVLHYTWDAIATRFVAELAVAGVSIDR